MRNFADDVGILYRGKIVETGPTADVFDGPAARLHASPACLRAGDFGRGRGHAPKDPADRRRNPHAENSSRSGAERSRQCQPNEDRQMIRIGIDVGGTNTDAVVMDGAR
jgi:ABC-type glutathione transport system ATPase component